MGGTHAPIKKKRRPYYQTVTVDVDIDSSVLEDNGYHHEEDCPANAADDTDHDDTADNLQRLSDWHDQTHGLSLWANCHHQPCNLLTDEFRRTP